MNIFGTHLWGLITLCFILPLIALAGPLEDALTIVFTESQVIQTRQRSLNLANEGSNLSVEVKLLTGYSEKQTNDAAAGFDGRATVAFQYPLYGSVSTTDKDKAAALSALFEAKENLSRSFILELQKLSIMNEDMASANRTHNLAIDLLKQAQSNNERAQKEGRLADKIDLTGFIDRAIAAENSARKTALNYRAGLEATARIYGKTRWFELMGHSQLYVKSIGRFNDGTSP